MVYRWLGKGASTKTMLEGSRTDPRPPMHSYKVTVITSDMRSAGTDADVFIDIKGQARLLCTRRQALFPQLAESRLCRGIGHLQQNHHKGSEPCIIL